MSSSPPTNNPAVVLVTSPAATLSEVPIITRSSSIHVVDSVAAIVDLLAMQRNVENIADSFVTAQQHPNAENEPAGGSKLLHWSKDASNIILQKVTKDDVPEIVMSSAIEVTDIKWKGRAVRAKSKIEKGTVVLVEVPFIGILDLEAESLFEEWEELATLDTAALAAQFASFPEAIPHTKNLYPRSANEFRESAKLKPFANDNNNTNHNSNNTGNPSSSSDVIPPQSESPKRINSKGKEKARSRNVSRNASPTGFADSDMSSDDEDDEDDTEERRAHMGKEVSLLLSSALKGKKLGNEHELTQLLIRKTRCNSLQLTTNSEQYVFPLRYQKPFSAAGLFRVASMFNHSCKPNVARFSIGNALCLVATTTINAGDELAISYIDCDELALPTDERQRMIDTWRFTCACTRCVSKTDGTRSDVHAAAPDEEAAIAMIHDGKLNQAYRLIDSCIRQKQNVDEESISWRTLASICSLARVEKSKDVKVSSPASKKRKVDSENTSSHNNDPDPEDSCCSSSSCGAESSSNVLDGDKPDLGSCGTVQNALIHGTKAVIHHSDLFGSTVTTSALEWYQARYAHEVKFVSKHLFDMPQLETIFWNMLKAVEFEK
eukprot:m.195143 g.195143  ORF g.195143 m.195143 type:complete len:605 (+) comp32550_c0_seq3:227-2041(+)